MARLLLQSFRDLLASQYTVASLTSLKAQSFMSDSSIKVSGNFSFFFFSYLFDFIRFLKIIDVVTTLAGFGSYLFLDGVGTEARFTNTQSITVSSNGMLYVGETIAIRMVTTSGLIFKFHHLSLLPFLAFFSYFFSFILSQELSLPWLANQAQATSMEWALLLFHLSADSPSTAQEQS